MMAIMFLPRQFQMAVVENVDESHIASAIWMFPVYLLAINVFVLPIAFGGLLHFPTAAVDRRLLRAHPADGRAARVLALLAFIGGLSAATGMVIVETIALSTMVCNNLVMPCCSVRACPSTSAPTSGADAWHPAGAIVLVLLPATSTSRSRARPTRWCPSGSSRLPRWRSSRRSCSAGSFWKGGTRHGALAALVAGFAVWFYTLLLPRSRARDGCRSSCSSRALRHRAVEAAAALRARRARPDHAAMLWSMIANIGSYVAMSLSASASADEHRQARVRRRVPGKRASGRSALLARHGLRAGLCNAARPASSARAARRVVPRPTRRRGGCDGRARLEADAQLVHHVECSLPARSAPLGARVWSPRWPRRRRSPSRRSQGPRRGLAGRGVQPPPRAEVARARGGDCRAARREREAEGARLAQGRLRLDRDPRAATPLTSIRAFNPDPARGPGDRARAATSSSASSPRRASA